MVRESQNIKRKVREATHDVCQKCRDKLHEIYLLTLQHSESEKVFHQITDVTVRLKKLKKFLISTDLKKEFEAIADTDTDVDLLECSSTVGHNYAVSGVAVKMECDNNFEDIDFNKVMKDLHVKYSNAADGRSVAQGKIDSKGNEDVGQITIKDEIIKEEWALQEGVIFESKAKDDILDREQTKFGCDVRDEEFTTFSCHNEHTKNVHENDIHEFNPTTIEDPVGYIQRLDTNNEFSCDQCGAKQKCRRGLKDDKLFPAGIPFRCDQCHAQFKHKINLGKQKLTHPNVLPADQCDATYKSKQALSVHKQVHSGLSFNCDQCDATYKSKQALNLHKLIHKGILFNCDQCGATFKTKQYLDHHKQMHKGISFSCDQCDATYKSKHALNQHKKIHSGISFNCDQCDATYKNKQALNVHKQIHSGISFNCDQCRGKCDNCVCKTS